jgi:HAD superfamily hydrolase (TIGR01549 family)
MDIEAVIFDLDETLLDTSTLRQARQQQHWSDVIRRLDEVRSYQLPDAAVEVTDLPLRLREAGVRVGVLTASPRHYAEALLEHFGISYDALVTGSDGYAAKPDPAGLLAIAEQVGVAIAKCAYVGDLDTDVATAVSAGALAVGVCWSTRPPLSWRRWWPELAIAEPGRLLELAEGERLRLLAEATLDGSEAEWHWGTLAAVEEGVFACGRYFQTGDSRHLSSPLSRLILTAKDDPQAAAQVADLLTRLSANPAWPGFDRVCSVPPKPGADYDRFSLVRERVADAFDAVDGVGSLEMLFDVPDYKHLSHDERRARNADRFRACGVAGERVLLIDDVVTSGGQAEACRAVLRAAGSGGVVIVGLGLTQDALPELCPQCGEGILRVYRRSSDGRPFLGCANWRRTGCSYKRDAG